MMRETISQLIEQMDGDEQIAKKSARELIAMGMVAVPAIIETSGYMGLLEYGLMMAACASHILLTPLA